MKHSTPIYTETISVKLTVAQAQRLCELAVAGRRTISQTLRIMLEPVLKTPSQAA
jgi:hypothetical protein